MMPTLFVIAGPNGIGKTTSCYNLVPAGTPIINSDEIAKEVRNAEFLNVSAQEYSNEKAIRLMEEQRASWNSFAIETNLADVDTWKFLLEVQKTGYQIHILYISTDDIEILNERIELRTHLGDHFVHPRVVEERYINSIKLLNHYFDKPEKLQLFDNSEKASLMLEAERGKILRLAKSLPNWITQNFDQHLQQREKNEVNIRDLSNIDEVRKSYELLKKNRSQEKGNKKTPGQSI
jgi:predicted ABC-type ATPase